MDHQLIKVHVRHLGEKEYSFEVFAGRSKKPIKIMGLEYDAETSIALSNATLTLTLPMDAFQMIYHIPSDIQCSNDTESDILASQVS